MSTAPDPRFFDEHPRLREERELKKFLLVENALPGVSGVLLSDQITACVSQFSLIDPFYPKNLKPAGYELTVGDQFSIGGEIKPLGFTDRITIPPFQVVVIKTAERLNLPRNMIARWNIKVSLAYEGLLWVGGPQVDPGWVGHLSCPIYNLSNTEVSLKYGDPVAVMDFVMTTVFTPNVSKEYNRVPKRVIFEDYEPQKLQSALYTDAAKKIETMQDELNKARESSDRRLSSMDERLATFTAITYTAMGVLVAALSIFVSSGAVSRQAFSVWLYIAVATSLISLVVSFASFWRKRHEESSNRNQNIGYVAAAGLIAAVVVIVLASLYGKLGSITDSTAAETKTEIGSLRDQVQQQKVQIETLEARGARANPPTQETANPKKGR